MMKFACKDLGMDCNFVATAATKEDLMKKITAHASVAHADVMKNMTKEQSTKFNAQVGAAIKTV